MTLSLSELQHRHRRTKKGTISNKRMSARKRASEAGLTFNISTMFLTSMWDAQEGCCALCGGELGYIGTGWCSASIDRIDPSKGYDEGNVQWTHWRCNDAKSNMTNTDFVNMCAAVTAKHFC